MTIIESVRNFIKTCPYLERFDGAVSVNVDCLSEEATSYSIEKIPTSPILKKYVGGGSLRQEVFIFCSREGYGEDVFQNIENSGFYEKFSEWIEEMNNKEIYPVLDEKRIPQKIEVTTNGYVFGTDIDNARYQIEFRLVYLQEV